MVFQERTYSVLIVTASDFVNEHLPKTVVSAYCHR